MIPDDVEKIIMTKEDYDRNVEQLLLDKCKAELEVERLNNIIKELEKWLVEWREMLDCPDFYEEGIIDCINDTLIKLQELKGDESNGR